MHAEKLNLHEKNFYLPSTTHRERAYMFLHMLKFVSHSLPELLLVLNEKKKRKGLVRVLSIHFVLTLASVHSCLSKIEREKERCFKGDVLFACFLLG